MFDADIDRSQFLPHGDPIVTPERAAKGDILLERNDNGEVRFAQAHVKNILNFLWEEEVCDDQQHHDCQTFQIWRDMHQVAFGLKKPISSGNPESLGIKLRAYGYILLNQRLNRYDQKAIETALETFATDKTRFIARNNKQAYRIAFINLSAALPPIREQISYLESLSELEQIELSENNLKKLVDEIAKRH